MHKFFWLFLLLLPLGMPADTVRLFQYDKNNQMIKEQKANGHEISYEYDPCGRVTKETTSDGAVVQFTYDKNGNCTQMTDAQGTTYYKYNLLNELIAVKFPNTDLLSYSYDAKGRLTAIMYPNGWKVAYSYDSSDRLITVTDQSGTTTYTYNDLANTLSKVTLANGVTTEYQYDPAKRITDVTHKRSDESIIASYHYTFDANGNRTQIVEEGSLGSKKTTCTYDKLNRLVSVEHAGGFEKYTYDQLGNRLSKETSTGVIHYEYDQRNRLIKAGDMQFFYDRSGNLIKKASPNDTAEYSYDAHDNLIEFRNSKYTVQYSYDGARRRTAKSVNGETMYYINDVRSPITQVMLKTTSSKQVAALYTYGLSRLAQKLPSGSCFYLYDYPDRSVIALVDIEQCIVNSYAYDSFGCGQYDKTRIPNDFSYAGEAYEAETGLIYLRNRYYDPELGRFISADAEFGSKTNPQSLNPYTYVNNNPLNFIDPLGLRSAKACAYAAGTKTKNGTSAIGHGFWVLTYDDGEVITIGRYPGESKKGYRENYDEICEGTYSYEWPATDEQIDQIIASVKKGAYLGVSGNCINGLERGLKVLGVEHPSFSEYGVSLPTKAIIWLESLNSKSGFRDKLQSELEFADDPDLYMARLSRGSQPKVASRSSGDVGGVALDKTAQLLGHISDVEGATYDSDTGQLIMIGKKKDIKLPEMDFDDLAVAVKSIYGLGGKKPQNPGVSLDMDPDHPVDFKKIKDGKTPHPMLTRFEGQTKGTRFGWIMFEADRILKCISLGKDNITGKKVEPDVRGYKNLIERYQKNKPSHEQVETRFWFVPKEMKIHKNKKGNSLAFKKATMEVQTETKYKHKKKHNSEAENFADHFTENYDKFAKRYPILKELKRLAKITAVVKWMKDNKIPLDLSLFEKYKPTHHDTPKKTPAVVASMNNENQNTILTIVGGVIYHLDDSNFHEIVNEDVNPLSNAALNARPSENVFKWTFKNPENSQEYQAVAQTIERTVKVGNVKKTYVDVRFPAWGDYPFELSRYYNSFNDNDIGLGRGWDLVGTALRFPRSRVNILWKNETAPIAVYPEIYVQEDGRELCYSLAGLGEQHNPIYKSAEEQAFLTEVNQGFIKSQVDGRLVMFTSDGRVLSKGRKNQVQIAYYYNDNRQLVKIEHKNGKAIHLVYEKERLIQATGPGDKAIYYSYNSYGELQHVSDKLGKLESYAYDSDKNLNKILNSCNETVFEAAYDDYHRAVSKIILGEKSSSSFDLKAHTSGIDKMGHSKLSSTYDSKYRLLNASDSAERQVSITYEEGQSKPKAITDCLGNQKQYTYDARGNVIRIVDTAGSEARFWYNAYNQVTASLDGMGRAELYLYNEQGRLSKVYHQARLVAEDPAKASANFSYDQVNATEYGYDLEKGLLLWVKQAGEITQSYEYDDDGKFLAAKNPAGYTLYRSYDAQGRLTKLWDSNGEGLEYSFDERDRLIKLSSHEGSLEYQYDAAGYLRSVQDALNGITTYHFDSFGNLCKIEDPQGGTTCFEYDEGRKLKRLLLPNGSNREIAYDSLNRPKEEIW